MVPGSSGFPLLFRLFEWWGSDGACPYLQEKRQAVGHLFAWGPAKRGCKTGTHADIKQSILEYRPQGPSLTAHPQGSLSHILLIASIHKGLSTVLCPVFPVVAWSLSHQVDPTSVEGSGCQQPCGSRCYNPTLHKAEIAPTKETPPVHISGPACLTDGEQHPVLPATSMVPQSSSSLQGFNQLLGMGVGSHCATSKGPTLRPLSWAVVIYGVGQCILPQVSEVLMDGPDDWL